MLCPSECKLIEELVFRGYTDMFRDDFLLLLLVWLRSSPVFSYWLFKFKLIFGRDTDFIIVVGAERYHEYMIYAAIALVLWRGCTPKRALYLCAK